MQIGDVVDGDIVFAEDAFEPGMFLAAAPAIKRTVKKWGLYRVDTVLANTPSSAVQDPKCGSYNTDVLCSLQYAGQTDSAGNLGCPAAQHCHDIGYFLPNHQQLKLLISRAATIDAADSSGGPATISAIRAYAAGLPDGNGGFWSSSEGDSWLNAVWISFWGSTNVMYDKRTPSWILPVRKVAPELPGGKFVARASIRGSIFLDNRIFCHCGQFSARAGLRGKTERPVWWNDSAALSAQRIFICILTGVANGLPDIELPISSLQYRQYGHGGTYLSVVVPSAARFAQEILARKNGEAVLYQGIKTSDGKRQLAIMARAGKIAVRHDSGGRNSSVTITAESRAQIAIDPTIPKVSGPVVVYALQNDGNIRLRCAPVFGLAPRDTLFTPDGPVYVDKISVSVGPSQQSMEVTGRG